MAVESTATTTGPLPADGITTVFNFTFKAASSEEVAAVAYDDDDEEATLPSFTASLTDSGGSVTFETAPDDGLSVYLYSAPDFRQQIEFEQGSRWLASPVNEANDRAALRDLWLKDRIERSPVAPLGGGVEGMFPVVLPGGDFGWSIGTGADAGLRTDLAASNGVSIVGGAASIASLASDSGFTLIKHKPQESGTYARTAAQRALAGIGDDGGTYVNHWIDPALDTSIALANGAVNTDLQPSFVAAADAAINSLNRGRTGALIIPGGNYTVAQTVELGFFRLQVIGRGRVVMQQMDTFVDPLFGVDSEVERPRIISCDGFEPGSTETFVRNHLIENIIVRGNGSDSDAFFDRGVANSDRRFLRARNIGGAMVTALGAIETNYEKIQALYAAEGSVSEVKPDYGVIVGRADQLGNWIRTTQCKFHVRIEQAEVAGVLCRYSEVNTFTGMVENINGSAVIVEAPSVSNSFRHFYCEANAGLDFDIYGSRNFIGDNSSSYNGPQTTSTRIRSGAELNVIADMGDTATVIQIDAGANYTHLRDMIAKNIIDNGTGTKKSGYILDLTQSSTPAFFT